MAVLFIKVIITVFIVVFYVFFIKKNHKSSTEDVTSFSEDQLDVLKENIKQAQANITKIEMCVNMILQEEDHIAVEKWCTEELSLQHDYLKLTETKQIAQQPPTMVPFHQSRYNVCKIK